MRYDNVIKALGYTPPKENTTYAVMKGATASAAGTSGLVPAPAAGDQGKYLRGDGTYGTPTNTTYSDATQTAHGLMSVSDKKKLDGIAEGANKTIVDSELSSTSTNPVQNKAVQAELTKKAPIASPSFTGTPKVPTASAGTNNTQAASTAFVTSAISTAMAGITKLDFQVVQTLPSTGVKGTFYLIANSGSGQNVYDEYLWINNKYEKLGTREIDLRSYISALNQSLGDLSNKHDWKKIGEFGDVNEHVISNIKNYQELRVNFMLYYSGGGSYITRDYVFPVSESKNLEFLFLDGNYYDSNNYTSWCIVYNTAKNSIQNRPSWLRSVISGKDTTCQCIYRVYGR